MKVGQFAVVVMTSCAPGGPALVGHTPKAKSNAPIAVAPVVGAPTIPTLAAQSERTSSVPISSTQHQSASAVPSRVRDVFAGSEFSCVLFEDGRAKCWGANGISGFLGVGDTRDRGGQKGDMGSNLQSIDLGSGLRIRQMSVGDYHACAVLEDGRVKCWGNNRLGELGLGDTRARGGRGGEMGDALPFVDLGTNPRALMVSAGNARTCAVLDDGKIKCWGDGIGDAVGEMGDALASVPLQEAATHVVASFTTSGGDSGGTACAIVASGDVACWKLIAGQMRPHIEYSDRTPTRRVVSITGEGQPCALLADGDFVCAYVGTLDDNARIKAHGRIFSGFGPMTAFSGARSSSACALNKVGQVGCIVSTSWEYPSSSEYGLRGLAAGEPPPIRISEGVTKARFGPNGFVSLGKGRRAMRIALGDYHACALLDDGSVKCWGSNRFGQLGLGDTRDRGVHANEMGDHLPAVDVGP